MKKLYNNSNNDNTSFKSVSSHLDIPVQTSIQTSLPASPTLLRKMNNMPTIPTLCRSVSLNSVDKAFMGKKTPNTPTDNNQTNIHINKQHPEIITPEIPLVNITNKPNEQYKNQDNNQDNNSIFIDMENLTTETNL